MPAEGQLTMIGSQNQDSSASIVLSSLRDDPDVSEVLPIFVEALPSFKTAMLEFAKVCDFEGVRREAHRLKGAAGGYGYEGLSDLASKLEHTCKTRVRDSNAILFDLDRVIEYVDRVR